MKSTELLQSDCNLSVQGKKFQEANVSGWLMFSTVQKAFIGDSKSFTIICSEYYWVGEFMKQFDVTQLREFFWSSSHFQF